MCMIEDTITSRVLVQHRLPKTTNPWCGLTFPGGHVEMDESSTTSVVSEISPYSQEVGPYSQKVGPKSPEVGQKAQKVGQNVPEVSPYQLEVGVETLEVGGVAVCDGSTRYDYGPQNLALKDVGFAVKMNVYRSAPGKITAESVNEPVYSKFTGQKQKNEPVNEPVNPDSTGKKQKNEPVNEPVNAVHCAIRVNPGINMPAIMAIVGKSRATIKRSIVELKEQGKIEFRGAPKTGGYYCKDEPLA